MDMLEQLSLFQLLKKNNTLVSKPSEKKVPVKNNKNVIEFIGLKVEIIRRPYQRSMSVLVRPNGRIRVTCARLTSKKILKGFLKEHEVWLKRALEDQKKLREKHPPKKYIQGEEFLFMGGTVHLNFSPSTSSKIQISVSGDQLNVFVPTKDWQENYAELAHSELRERIVKFYKETGKKLLASRMEYLSQKLKLKPNKVSFRSQKTRWGSCGSNGNITLNWRLIAAPIEVQEYVIVHELCHLKFQDHSKDFWQLVKQYAPNIEEYKCWLRTHQFDLDFLAETSELHE